MRKKQGKGPEVPPSSFDYIVTETRRTRRTRRPDGTVFTWWKDKAERQALVLRWRERGETPAAIAKIVGVSERTVFRDLAAFWRQIGVTSRLTPGSTRESPCQFPNEPPCQSSEAEP